MVPCITGYPPPPARPTGTNAAPITAPLPPPAERRQEELVAGNGGGSGSGFGCFFSMWILCPDQRCSTVYNSGRKRR